MTPMRPAAAHKDSAKAGPFGNLGQGRQCDDPTPRFASCAPSRVERLLRRRPIAALAATIASTSATSEALAQQLPYVPVLARGYDDARTGANNQEVVLNQNNVHSGTFGHLFTQFVNDEILAQVLYVPNIPGMLNNPTTVAANVIFAVTVKNSVIALDADTGTVYWAYQFGTPPTWQQIPQCPHPILTGNNQNFDTYVGSVSTPVIDLAPADGSFGYLYVVTRTYQSGVNPYQLWKLGLESGTAALMANISSPDPDWNSYKQLQ